MPIPSKQVLELSLSPGIVRAFTSVLFFLSASSLSYAQPSHPPGEGRRGPPPEAFAACEQSTENDVCKVVTSRGELAGICRKDRRSEALLCTPKNRPGRGDNNNKPSKPIEEKAQSDSSDQTE